MELDGWNIDVEALPGPDRDKILYISDAIFPSPDGIRAALIYSIDEVRMGMYMGKLAVYRNRDLPCLEFNPLESSCMHTGESIVWLTNEVFAVRKYFALAEHSFNVPFVLIDLARQLYAFIPFVDGHSYSLSLTEAGIQIVERSRDGRFPSRDGEIYPSQELRWFSLADFDAVERRYKQFFALA